MKTVLFLISCYLLVVFGEEHDGHTISEHIISVEESSKPGTPPTMSPVEEGDNGDLHDAPSNSHDKINEHISVEESSKPVPPPTMSPVKESNAQDTPSNSDEEQNQSIPSPDKSNDNGKDGDEASENAGDYKKGSICIYCRYCKLCTLCDERCPCEKTENEHCDMCKYCKYCSFCGTVCDTVCTPGGFLDMFSSAVYDVLPTFSDETKKDVNEDIEKAKNFIKEYL